MSPRCRSRSARLCPFPSSGERVNPWLPLGAGAQGKRLRFLLFRVWGFFEVCGGLFLVWSGTALAGTV